MGEDPCIHLMSSDWSWLASRLLNLDDLNIYHGAVDTNLRSPRMRRLYDNDWGLYCRVRARVAMAVLGALIPLCDLRR